MRDPRLRAALISICCNVFLVALKLVGARLSASLALNADAIHSLSDIFVSLLVLAGVVIAAGRTKWLKTIENAVALLISFPIMGAACGLMLKAFTTEDYAISNTPVAVVLVWICIVISYLVARYKIQVGRQHASVSIEADGYHSMMDMYSSVAVLVGLLGQLIGFRLDALASGIVAVLVFKVGVEVLFGGLRGLAKSDVLTLETVSYLRKTEYGQRLLDLRQGMRAATSGDARSILLRSAASCWSLRRWIAALLVASALLGYVATGFYEIAPDEVGMVLRCGKLIDENVPPGLHYRLPSPFSTLRRVKPEAVRLLEFGFRRLPGLEGGLESGQTLWESAHQGGGYQKVESEAVMLTGDVNEVDVNLCVEYCVTEGEAAAYLFNLAQAEALVRASAESVVRQVIGALPLNAILTTARPKIQEDMAERLQALLDSYKAGIRVVGVRLQDIHPPLAVVPAFRYVATAREQKATAIARAEGYRRSSLPEAYGGVATILAYANAYRAEKVSTAAGDAAYFGALTKAFEMAPDVASFKMYMDAVEEYLPALRKVILDSNVGGGELERYFLMGEFLGTAVTGLGSVPQF